MNSPTTSATWQVQADAAHHKLRRIAALITEYEQLADRTGNTDLAIFVFQIQAVLDDQPTEPFQTIHNAG